MKLEFGRFCGGVGGNAGTGGGEGGGMGVGTGDTVPIKYTSIQLICVMDENPINQS
jgi:hypothetical protein